VQQSSKTAEKTKPRAQPGPEKVLAQEKVAKLVAALKITEDGARSNLAHVEQSRLWHSLNKRRCPS
jgi:hypothetical protein